MLPLSSAARALLGEADPVAWATVVLRQRGPSHPCIAEFRNSETDMRSLIPTGVHVARDILA